MQSISTRQQSHTHAHVTPLVAAFVTVAVGVAAVLLVAVVGAGSWPTAASASGEGLGTELMRTIAGTGEGGFSGDGGPATEAQLYSPDGVALDGDGNVYIADSGNYRVRKVDPDGTITTVAGSGEPGFSGDGGPATEARLDSVSGLAVDSAGNIYVADTSNHRVRKVDPSGTITTVAGSGDTGYGGGGFAGDGGPATEALLDNPAGVTLDDAGNLYIADNYNHRVRKVDTDGVITTVAGSGSTGRRGGFSGDGGPATEAELNRPIDVASDEAGNVYIADRYNGRVRRLDTDGIITTEAEADADALAVDDSGSLFIADSSDRVIRRLDRSGDITTVAGTGARFPELVDEVPPLEADLGSVGGLAIDEEIGPEGDTRGLLLGDSRFDVVRQVVRAPDLLEASMSASEPFNVGEDPGYTVEVTNKGLAGTASGVTLTDELPDRLDFASSEATQGSCSEAGGTVTCALGELAPGDTTTVTLTVAPAKPGIVVANTATVSPNENDPFPYDNNSATVRTPVGDAGCGQVISKDTTLSQDIGPCPFDGIIVGADDVTLDLGGHHVSGFHAFDDDYASYDFLDADSKAGIRLPGRTGVTVTNGAVSGFSAGVVLGGGSNNTITQMTLLDNVGPVGTNPPPDLGDGIFVFNSPGNEITDNTFRRNGVFDSIAIYGPDSDDNEVRGNLIEDTAPPEPFAPGGTGIIVNGADADQGTISNTVVAENTIRDNNGPGISNLNHVEGQIVNNKIFNNGGFTGNGIGIRAGNERDYSGLRVANNEVRGSRSSGMRILSDGNEIVNNLVAENSSGLGILGAQGNEMINNTGRDNRFNDFYDYSRDPETGEYNCHGNTWQNNHANGDYFPDCTVNRGSGSMPTEAPDPANREPRELPDRGPPEGVNRGN